MAESTPPSRSRKDSAAEPRSSRPLRLVDERARELMPSHPPSEPRPIKGRPGADAGPDRPVARVQLISVLLLLLVLVVVPLYLWRRPRTVNEEADAAVAAASVQAAVVAATPAAQADAGVRSKNGVTVGETKVIGCHDPGPRRTAPSEFDHLAGFEAAFARAILDNGACLPPETAAGAITYVADVSYGRRHNPVRVTYSREATSVPARDAAACALDVKKTLADLALDPTHGHSRYEIELSASYAGGSPKH